MFPIRVLIGLAFSRPLCLIRVAGVKEVFEINDAVDRARRAALTLSTLGMSAGEV